MSHPMEQLSIRPTKNIILNKKTAAILDLFVKYWSNYQKDTINIFLDKNYIDARTVQKLLSQSFTYIHRVAQGGT